MATAIEVSKIFACMLTLHPVVNVSMGVDGFLAMMDRRTGQLEEVGSQRNQTRAYQILGAEQAHRGSLGSRVPAEPAPVCGLIQM